VDLHAWGTGPRVYLLHVALETADHGSFDVGVGGLQLAAGESHAVEK
jgi:hypothetical protein